MMVGRQAFPFGMVTFQGLSLLNFGGVSINHWLTVLVDIGKEQNSFYSTGWTHLSHEKNPPTFH